jgi:hypothetical protein
MWVNVWKFLHIAAMFAAASLFVGQGLLSAAIAKSHDVRAIRRTLAAEARFGPLGGGLFLGGIVFGFVTADRRLRSHGPMAPDRVRARGAHPGDRDRLPRAAWKEAPGGCRGESGCRAVRRPSRADPGPECPRRPTIDVMLWLAIIYVMVAKPFS